MNAQEQTKCPGCGRVPDKGNETGEWEQVYQHETQLNRVGGGAFLQMNKCPGKPEAKPQIEEKE